MALLEAAAGKGFAKFSAFADQRVGPDAAAATHEGKVAKTLNINDVDEETPKGMLEARQKEWDKYRSFNAAVIVSGAEKARLLSEGHQVIPSKWVYRVDTIKNIHEMNSPDFKPVYKSRLVSYVGTLKRSTRKRSVAIAQGQGQSPIWCCATMPLLANFGFEQRSSRTPILSGGSDGKVVANGPTSRRIDDV